MKELLQDFSLTQILFFLIVFLFAVRETIVLVEFFYTRIRKAYNSEYGKDKEKESISSRLQDLENRIQLQEQEREDVIAQINKISNSCDENFSKQKAILDMLIESDRDDIKSWIIKEYHHFVEEKHWIDDFSLDTIEKRFVHYQAEGGEEYLEGLLVELRKLPRNPH